MRRIYSWMAGLPLLLSAAAAQGADGALPEAMVAVDSDGFRAVTGAGDAATIPGGTLMLIAYIVFFVLIGGYTLMLANRHKKVQEELRNLRIALEDLDDRLDEAERRNNA